MSAPVFDPLFNPGNEYKTEISAVNTERDVAIPIDQFLGSDSEPEVSTSNNLFGSSRKKNLLFDSADAPDVIVTAPVIPQSAKKKKKEISIFDFSDDEGGDVAVVEPATQETTAEEGEQIQAKKGGLFDNDAPSALLDTNLDGVLFPQGAIEKRTAADLKTVEAVDPSLLEIDGSGDLDKLTNKTAANTKVVEEDLDDDLFSMLDDDTTTTTTEVNDAFDFASYIDDNSNEGGGLFD
jgi:hypothetical protein